MIFDRLFAKAQSSKPSKSTSMKKKSPKNLFLQENNNLTSINDLNQALAEIEDLAKKEKLSDHLLLRKADILLRKGKIKQSRQILTNLASKKGKSKTSNKARELLSLAHLLQQKSSCDKAIDLAINLHKIASKYNETLTSVPSEKDIKDVESLIQGVREESRRAINSGLPMLAYELTNKALEINKDSAWLLLQKAISLGMIGQRSDAISILERLKESNHGERITKSINKALNEINTQNKPQQQLKFNIYLTNHLKSITKGQDLELNFLPQINTINATTKVKTLIFNEALKLIETQPQETLILTNAILDYAPEDGASLQLKGEALAALKQNEKAIQTWKLLTHSSNQKIAKKAYISISEIISKRAKRICQNKSPKEAAIFFVQQHLKHKLEPNFNKTIGIIINQMSPLSADLTDSTLQKHELQLKFNTMIIECLETQFDKQGQFRGGDIGKTPDPIRKTEPKAG